jgi:acyl carrier protein
MNVTEFILAIEPELREADERPFAADTVLRDLPNWSSMLALLIIARVDDLYGVQISASEFARIRTLSDLHHHVSQHLPA